jgi:hypothetical protein
VRNVLTVVSAILCAAVVVAFLLSEPTGDQAWEWGGAPQTETATRWEFMLGKTRLRIARYAPGLPPATQPIRWRSGGFAFDDVGYMKLLPQEVPRPNEAVGFFYSGWGLTVPLWAILLPSLVLPARYLWLKRRRAPAAGLCRACRYDLRGNVSGVCPECGTSVGATG